MSELNKTLAFVVVAVLLTGAAALATRPRMETPAEFQELGEPFFADFKDPLAATSLEVIDYDADTASALPFKVMLKGKGKDARWLIPSHHDYAADAKDRLAKTAAGVIDLTKDVLVSDSPDDYEKLGVIDPLDTKTTALKGRGKRVTLKNKNGEVLADFIIGKSVPGQENQRYVRVPDQKRTYAVNVNVDLSARFADWIETNLLKLDTGSLREVTFDNHKVDPERGSVEQGEVLTIKRTGPSDPWKLEGGIAPDKEMNTTALSQLTSSLADLKIVGVRPKPEGLTKALRATADGSGVKLTRESIASLANRGFYLTRDGRLLSNQGDVIIQTEKGIIYTLRFGEVTFATGEALSAGSEEEAKAQAKEKKDQEGSSESRYLFVTAEFDAESVPKPKALTDAETPSELPSEVFARTPEEVKADEADAKDEKELYESKLEEGRKTAKDLSDRFAEWYYVVPGDAFREIVLNREDLTRPKGSGAPAPGAAFPGGPGGGLPPGLNIPGHP